MNSFDTSLQGGFTLLELVVVLAIFGLVAVMAYGGLNNVLKTRVAIEDNLERVSELQRAYLRMREDFQQLQPRAVRDEFGEPQSAVVGRREEGVEIVHGGWRNPAGHPRSQLQRVRWFVEDDQLIRGHYRYLDRAPRTEPERLRVLDNVERMTLRYLDGNREWQPEWPPNLRSDPDAQGDPTPPLAIEVTLETEQWGELTVLFPSGSTAALQGASGAPGSGLGNPGSGTGFGAGDNTGDGSASGAGGFGSRP